MIIKSVLKPASGLLSGWISAGWLVGCLAIATLLLGPAAATPLSLILAIGALICAWTSARAMLAVLVFSCGSSGLTFSVGPFTFLPEHVAVLFLLRHALAARQWAGRDTARTASFLLMVGWFVLAAATSALAPPDPWESLRMVAWMAVGFFALTLIQASEISAESAARTVANTTIAYSSVALAGWLFAGDAAWARHFAESDYASTFLRAQGLMPEPNLLASFLVLALTLSLAFSHAIPPGVLVTQTALAVVLVFLTFTRTAWVVLALVLIAFAIKRRKGLFLLLLLTSIAAVLWIDNAGTFSNGIGQASSARVDNFFSLSSGTGKFRADASKAAVREIAEGPLWTGRGVNAFPQTHFAAITSDGRLYLSFWWLALVYDTGFAGFILFIASLTFFGFAAGRKSVTFLAALSMFAATTNPLWYAFPWVLGGLLLQPSGVPPARTARGTPGDDAQARSY